MDHGADRKPRIARIAPPHVDNLGLGLFELRAKGQEGIGRALFVIAKPQRVVILHAFQKKRQKAPKQAIDLARQRAKVVT